MPPKRLWQEPGAERDGIWTRPSGRDVTGALNLSGGMFTASQPTA
jgi:hypothetical protein